MPVYPFTWQTYGNNVNNNKSWIGTNGNYDFNVKTSAQHRLILKGNGDIAFGAFDPLSLYRGEGNKFRFYIDNASGDINMGTPCNGDPNTNCNTQLTIKANGNLGIGTRLINNPNNYKLAVNGLIASSGFKIVNDFSGTPTENLTLFGDGKIQVRPLVGTDKYFVLKAANGAQAENFVIYGSGKTEIGPRRLITGPHADALLSVNGKIACTEVRVFTNGWSDYVFEKNYKLLPLEDLETYYVKYKHLPNLPTTKEVLDNGVDLAKTDALLLEKIEELTLYIVELKKEVDNLKKKK